MPTMDSSDETNNSVATADIKDLKTKRSSAKRNITRLINKINSSLNDSESLPDVEQLFIPLTKAFEHFSEVHQQYHELIEDEDEVDISQCYFEKVESEFAKVKNCINQFTEVESENQVNDSHNQSSALNKISDSMEVLAQRLRELELTAERERHEYSLKLLVLQKESEIANQRLEHESKLRKQEADIEEEGRDQQRLQKVEEKNTSTPTRDTSSRLSFGVSSISDSSMILAEALKTIMEESRQQQQMIVDSINTPRIQLSKYDGSPLKYWPFIRSFENTVEAKTKDNSIRLDTLIQHCTGEVNDLLQCCLLKEPNEGYALARTMLKDTYGDDETIATAWLDRILKRPKLKSLRDIRTFANDLKTCQETLKTMKYLSELETRTNLRAIAEKLPDHIYDRWVMANYNIKEKEGCSGNLAEIIKFLDRVAREATDTTFPARDIDPSHNKSHKQIHATNIEPIDQMSNSPSQRNSYSCRMCKDSHYLNQCSIFRGLSVAERTDFVKCQDLCMNCFRSGHQAETCTYSWVCNIEGCGAKHNRWLHPTTSAHTSTQLLSQSNDRSQSQTSAITQTSNHHLSLTTKCTYRENVALPIIPILVKGSNQKIKKVYAMLDNGSTGSLCTEGLLKELGLPYQTSLASLTTVDRENQMIACKLVDLEVQDVSQSYSSKMCRVMTRESLNISSESYIASAALSSWPHLADLEMPTTERNQVDLLIGQDHSELLVPLEVRTGKDKEPFAIRTHLGWAVNGNLAIHNTAQKYSVHFNEKEQNLDHVDLKKEQDPEATSPLGKSPSSPSMSETKDAIASARKQWKSPKSLPIAEKKRLRHTAANKGEKKQAINDVQKTELKAEIEDNQRIGRVGITRNQTRMNKRKEEMKDTQTYTATEDKSFKHEAETEENTIDKRERKRKAAERSKVKDADTEKDKPVRFSTQSLREMHKDEQRTAITTQPKKNGENFQVAKFEAMCEEVARIETEPTQIQTFPGRFCKSNSPGVINKLLVDGMKKRTSFRMVQMI